MATWMKSRDVWLNVAGVLVLAVGSVAMYSRIQYGYFNPWSAPERLDYCNAHFYRYDADDHVGMLGDGAIVTKAQALAISGSTALVAHGSTGLFGQWPVYLPANLKCPQDPQHDQLMGFMFIGLGPDRYLELTDSD